MQTIEENYLEVMKPQRMKLQKHYKAFSLIINSFPNNYFSVTDISELEELIFLQEEMQTIKTAMKMNNIHTDDNKTINRYNKQFEIYNKMLKSAHTLRTSLRITKASRSSPNRSGNSITNDVPATNSNRDNAISADPFESGIPNQ